MGGQHVRQAVGGQLPVRLRVAELVGEQHAAPQPLVDGGAAGQQRVRGRLPARVALPDDLPALGLQPGHVVQRGLGHRPPPLGEGVLTGDEKVVPEPDGEVGGVVGLAARLDRHPVEQLHRPGAVVALVPGEPVVAPAHGLVQSGDRHGHQALDVVPRVDVPFRPGHSAVFPLDGRDALGRPDDLLAGDHAAGFLT
jgi:hypothetical protein